MARKKLILVAVENPISTEGISYYSLLLIGNCEVLEFFPRLTKEECEETAASSLLDLQFIDWSGNFSAVKKAVKNDPQK